MAASSRSAYPFGAKALEGGGMAQVKNVVVVFADLVDATGPGDRLPVSDGIGRHDRAVELLRGAVTAHGGTPVWSLDHDAMVVFSSASGALECVIAMQRDVERAKRQGQATTAVDLRVGVSAGEVVDQDGHYVGEAIVEAATLCDHAERGQILVADLVRVLLGRWGDYVFSPADPVLLEGSPDVIETLSLDWVPVVGGEPDTDGDLTVPLPGPLTGVPDIGRVLGREEDQDALTQAYKRVAAGEGREVVLMSGEPGVGKSTLAASLARRAHELGAVVLLGHYDETVTVSYQGFSEALTHYVDHVPDEVLEAHVREDGPELALMVPALRRRMDALPADRSTDPDTSRYLLFSAAVSAVARAQMAAPVVVVLEDLHWADTQSLQLFRHLVSSSGPLRLMLIGTYREEVGPAHPLTQLVAALRREHGITHLNLHGLDEAGVLGFLEAAWEQNLDDAGADLAHALWRETDGNPFFVSEVLRHLLETGALHHDDDGRLVATAPLDQATLPTSVRQVISARVARLGESALRVLSLAAVVGRDFDLEVVARASGHDEDDLLDLFDEAQAASVLAETPDVPGRYRFAHALIPHTLATDMGPTRRARAHRMVAQAFESLLVRELGLEGIDVEDIARLDLGGSGRAGRVRQLAHHYSRTTNPTDQPRAVAYCYRAGQVALRLLAPDEAGQWFERATELLDDGERNPALAVDVLIGLGTAQRHAGNPAHRPTLLEAAREAQVLGATDRLTEAILSASDGGLPTALGVVDQEKVACLEAALAAVDGSDQATRAALLASLSGELAFGAPLERRLQLAREALSLAHELGDARVIVEVTNRVQYSLDAPETLPDRLAQTTEALSLGEGIGDPALWYWTAWLHSIAAMQAARPGELRRAMAIMGSLNELIVYPVAIELALVRQAAMAMLHGDPDEAERLAGETLEIGMGRGQLDALAVYGAQLIVVRWQQGRLSEMVELLSGAADENPGVPAFRAAQSLAHLEGGDEDAARSLLETAARSGFVDVPRDTAWSVALHSYAGVAIELGVRGAADMLFDRLRPWHDQIEANAAIVTGPFALDLGALAAVSQRFDEAEQYFREAAALNERMEARFFETQTDLEWGRMLAARHGPGDDTRAAEHLVAARSQAHARGYRVLGRRAEAALHALD